jgi:L-fucose isomerase
MKRLVGRLPKIGIRPVIDGREKGVRESLEDQCMEMAIITANLIEDNLRFPSGEKVMCVIADNTIGGVFDAASCADKFKREGVEISITVTPCWCYGTEVMDTDPLMPKAVWGFNGTERPGAVYLAAALAAYSQIGLPTFGIFGREVQDVNDMRIPKDVKEKLLRFTKAALVIAQMKGKSYL